jgi:hypothetical protein
LLFGPPFMTGSSSQRWSATTSRVAFRSGAGGGASLSTIWSTLMCPQQPRWSSTI